MSLIAIPTLCDIQFVVRVINLDCFWQTPVNWLVGLLAENSLPAKLCWTGAAELPA